MCTNIASAIKEKVAVLFDSNTSFGVLTDGSEPKKNGSEKELVSVQTVNQDVQVYYCIGLEDFIDHGGAESTGLKFAIDEVFAGLGVNTDMLKYEFVQPWIIIVYPCSNTKDCTSLCILLLIT